MSGHANKRRHPTVDDLELAYLDVSPDTPPSGGHEPPTVVLLHGNPTSSFLWRTTIPPLTAAGARCIAPDLLGMGDSDRLPTSGPDSYDFFDHRRHLDAFLDALVPPAGAVFVVHDWGSALGFHWAHRHPDRVRAIAYLEALVRPVTWDEWPEASRGLFQAMRGEAGEQLVLERNIFVERILPASVLEPLSDEVLEEYRRPYREPGESRRPTLSWPRQIPIDGEPADVHRIVKEYGDWLATDQRVPKLFIDADPGSILVGGPRAFARSWPNQRIVGVAGSHFVPEDSGGQIGEHVARWLGDLAILRA